MGTKIILKTDKETDSLKIEGFIQTEDDKGLFRSDAIGYIQEATKEKIKTLKMDTDGNFAAQTENYRIDIVDESHLL